MTTPARVLIAALQRLCGAATLRAVSPADPAVPDLATQPAAATEGLRMQAAGSPAGKSTQRGATFILPGSVGSEPADGQPSDTLAACLQVFERHAALVPADLGGSLLALIGRATSGSSAEDTGPEGRTLSHLEAAVSSGRRTLETAVRLGRDGAEGFAWLAFARPAADFPSSLAQQARLLDELQVALGHGAERRALVARLVERMFGDPRELAWLAPGARAMLFGCAYKPGLAQPVLKLYCNSRLDPRRPHAAILGAVWELIGAPRLALAQRLDAAVERCLERGLGLDLPPQGPARLKLYWRLGWPEADRLRGLLAREGVLLEAPRWDELQRVLAAEPALRSPHAELAVSFEPAEITVKVNVFIAGGRGAEAARRLLAGRGWPLAHLTAALDAQDLGAGAPAVYAMAAGLSSVEPGPLNVYCAPRWPAASG